MVDAVGVRDVVELPSMLSPDEVATWLGVRRPVVYTLLQRGTLPVVRVGRLLRVPTSAVQTFIASGGRR